MHALRRVILTGGPGAGKTTLLDEFGRLGYRTVAESARAVIAERLALGQTPRPDPVAFAREILRRDEEKYQQTHDATDWVYFDRSAIESLGMVDDVAPFPPEQLRRALAQFRFHPTVFVLPPWQDIYVTDAERDQTYAQSQEVHAQIVRWYRTCGYSPREVPCLPVAQRAQFVLRTLSGMTPGSR